MKLEVGIYVRTKCGIEQIYRIDNNKTKWKYVYKLKEQDGDGCINIGILSSEDVLKASHNILDLIEPMDLLYVDISPDNCGGIVVPRIPETYCELEQIKDNIKLGKCILIGIVTKELLNKNTFEVGGYNE